MNILEVALLGIVQGLTEFIPVSSSGHLVILHELLGISSAGLALDVALHIGTLIALVVYFWKDVLDLAKCLFEGGDRARLPLLIALACVPAVVAGVVLQDLANDAFRSPLLVALNLALFGGVMFFAEKYAVRKNTKSNLEKLTLKQAVVIGSFQAIALVPGVSRSGSTIAGGLFQGLDKITATRFSFLLAIPITFGAIVKLALDGSMASLGSNIGSVLVGIMAAFLSGLFAIRFLLSFLTKYSIAWFFYYRLVLALLIALVVYYTS